LEKGAAMPHLFPKHEGFSCNMIAIFLKPLILRALRARKIKGFRKMAKVSFVEQSKLW